ncbi:MAG: hypothetical protein Q4D17_10155, partial [Planctomycetia bacterium]|nr:hypothetical protein [Planctomycetia bacterium]
MNQKVKSNLQNLGLGICLTLGLSISGNLYAQDAPKSVPAPAVSSARTVLQVLANVNNEEIGRQKVIDACLEDYGQQVLASLVTRFVLNNACAEAGVSVTDEEILA